MQAPPVDSVARGRDERGHSSNGGQRTTDALCLQSVVISEVATCLSPSSRGLGRGPFKAEPFDEQTARHIA